MNHEPHVEHIHIGVGDGIAIRETLSV